ncbi:MAG: membrane protein insertion efficiency factor YidD [Thermodesulfobacteriota bacterium]|nr:MAG: membrane protein insertion efficiency factor YidD [Thermodesulfobacteriota bacterium]
MVKRPLMLLIFLYKRLVSPVLPRSCRFYPTCSEYAYGAISHHGAIKGLFLSAKRLLKCHPFNPGGFDPVPASEDVYKKDKVKGIVL